MLVCKLIFITKLKRQFPDFGTHNKYEKRKKFGDCLIVFRFRIYLHVKICKNTKQCKDANAESHKQDLSVS